MCSSGGTRRGGLPLFFCAGFEQENGNITARCARDAENAEIVSAFSASLAQRAV
jgi:hypothetical protein